MNSRNEDHYEAVRWLDTAAEDLVAARTLAAAGHHAHACFEAQQCAEKAVKAGRRLLGLPGRSCSVRKLLEDFPGKDELGDTAETLKNSSLLDRFYIPTRYPDGLPDLTPEKAYFAADSEAAIKLADAFGTTFRRWIAEN
jgi:HEPN domain-containing protein